MNSHLLYTRFSTWTRGSDVIPMANRLPTRIMNCVLCQACGGRSRLSVAVSVARSSSVLRDYSSRSSSRPGALLSRENALPSISDSIHLAGSLSCTPRSSRCRVSPLGTDPPGTRALETQHRIHRQAGAASASLVVRFLASDRAQNVCAVGGAEIRSAPPGSVGNP